MNLSYKRNQFLVFFQLISNIVLRITYLELRGIFFSNFSNRLYSFVISIILFEGVLQVNKILKKS